MTTSYEDALQDALAAVRRGEDLEAALERHPAHAAALREEMRLAEGVSKLSLAAPRPSAEAKMAASRRMMAQLEEQRAKRSGVPGWFRGGGGFARYVAAAALVVFAVLGAGLLLGRDGASVEAATIEGVVVENDGVMLTVQTLDALERVSVPPRTRVSDDTGGPIDLAGIEVGQVVVIEVQRSGREVVAQRIERYRESIEAWCIEDSAQCQALLAGIDRAVGQCELAPLTCRVTLERLEQLRQRAAESAPIEGLRRECRAAVESACDRIEVFCRERPGACSERFLDFIPSQPSAEPTRPSLRPTSVEPAQERVAPATTPEPPAVTPGARTDIAPTPAPRNAPTATSTPPSALDTATPVSRGATPTLTPTATPVPQSTPVLRDVELVEATPARGGDAPSRATATPSPQPDASGRNLTAPASTPAPVSPQVDSPVGLDAPPGR